MVGPEIMHAHLSLVLRDLRVLIVEDEPLVSMSLADELERCEGITVGPVSTIGNAMALLQLEAVDAAILDIELRGERAYPVADRLLAGGVPFIFSTAMDEEHIPERFAGVPVCPKPAPALEILLVLADHIHPGD